MTTHILTEPAQPDLPDAAAPAPPWALGERAPLTGSWWARGLWLAERLAADGQPPHLPDGEPERGSLGWRAARRLERWRAAFPELVADTAAVQTEAFGTDLETLHRLLAESPDGLAARALKPDWADFVERVVARASQSAQSDAVGGAHEEPSATHRHGHHDAHDNVHAPWFEGFGTVVGPFVAEARRMLLAARCLADPATPAVLDAGAVLGSLTHSLRALWWVPTMSSMQVRLRARIRAGCLWWSETRPPGLTRAVMRQARTR